MKLANNLSSTAQATLLLTSYFSKPDKQAEKPLTNTEWGRFALWLKDNDLSPSDLLDDTTIILQKWQDKKITQERLNALLQRGHSLALAVEKWQRAGLWVITRADPAYPKRLKSRLRNNAPAVLFGCGNREILNLGGIAVVGSRKVDSSDLDYTSQLGIKAAKNELTIVSGGARGVDETAMLSAMNAGGNVVGVLANSLLQAATSNKWRKGLMEGNVVLVSTFYPEAGFNVGNAMARNRYIYCLSDATVVVHSGMKGGTITGAKENIKNNWVPLWIKPTEDNSAANSFLVKEGARWCAASVDQLDVFDLMKTQPSNTKQQEDLLSPSLQQNDLFSDAVREPSAAFSTRKIEENVSTQDETDTKRNNVPADFYQLFISEVRNITIEKPASMDDIIKRTKLNKSQVTVWLKESVEKGIVKKLTRPVRYKLLK